jgi:hypothetical protein
MGFYTSCGLQTQGLHESAFQLQLSWVPTRVQPAGDGELTWTLRLEESSASDQRSYIVAGIRAVDVTALRSSAAIINTGFDKTYQTFTVQIHYSLSMSQR